MFVDYPCFLVIVYPQSMFHILLIPELDFDQDHKTWKQHEHYEEGQEDDGMNE
jgi:hypothetical protein